MARLPSALTLPRRGNGRAGVVVATLCVLLATVLAASSVARGAHFFSALVLVVGTVSAAAAYLATRDVLAPPVLWLCSWTGALALGRLDVYLKSAYAGAWSPSLWTAIIGAAVAFSLGGFAVLLRGPRSRPASGRKLPAVVWSRERLDSVILAFFVLAASTYAAMVVRAGGISGIPIFSDKPAYARHMFGIQGTSYLFLLFGVVVLLTVVGLLWHGGWRANKRNLLLSCFAIFAFLSAADRSAALEVLLAGFFMYSRARGFSVRRAGAIAGALAAIFITIGLIRLRNDLHGQALFSTVYVGIGNPLLAMGYLYFGTAFNNLQYVLRAVEEHTYGVIALRVPLGMLQLDHLVRPPEIDWEAWNTVTGLAPYYFDFGWFGIFAIPLLLGAVATRLYVRAGTLKNPADLVLFGVAATSTVASITTERFFEGTTLWYAAMTLAAAWLCKRRPPVPSRGSVNDLRRAVMTPPPDPLRNR